SRATSKELEPEPLDAWARRKGIGLVGTGDFTHPTWRAGSIWSGYADRRYTCRFLPFAFFPHFTPFSP
ncbi:endonuclease Q family protein, partial [Flavonifractor plautii]|uniref:endonuclease Q family protein n=1 Tax=Flavonifractor plautii TaxID=292800 RepID=UPI00210C1636